MLILALLASLLGMLLLYHRLAQRMDRRSQVWSGAWLPARRAVPIG